MVLYKAVTSHALNIAGYRYQAIQKEFREYSGIE